jgi:hypothetical protein
LKQYRSYFVTFRGQPFVNLLCNEQTEVEQFIVDWCQSNNIRPSADEWAIQPDVPAMVSKDIVSQICVDSGGDFGEAFSGRRVSKFQAVPGLIDVRPNPKMWG